MGKRVSGMQAVIRPAMTRPQVAAEFNLDASGMGIGHTVAPDFVAAICGICRVDAAYHTAQATA